MKTRESGQAEYIVQRSSKEEEVSGVHLFLKLFHLRHCCVCELRR